MRHKIESISGRGAGRMIDLVWPFVEESFCPWALARIENGNAAWKIKKARFLSPFLFVGTHHPCAAPRVTNEPSMVRAAR